MQNWSISVGHLNCPLKEKRQFKHQKKYLFEETTFVNVINAS
jgi:hypothetical protein